MAGINFELRKLFADEEEVLFGNIKAYLFSAIVSIGPWIISATALNLILFISSSIELPRSDRILFMSTTFYVFIFSQIITSVFQYIVTRYVSDCIFNKKIYKIKSSFLGIIKLVTILSFITSALFIRRGTLSNGYKVVFILLFVFMSLSWITMIYIALLKKYKFILFSFFLGNLVSVILGFFFLKYSNLGRNEPLFWMLLSYAIGIFLNFVLTAMYTLRAFHGQSKNQFEFLAYFKGYFSLVLIGIFYILGLWSHVFVNWFLGDSYVLADTFIVSPIYEVAVFYTYCTTVPSIIYFSIFMETKFLPLYKEYFNKLCVTGKYEAVEQTLKNLKQTIIGEILYCMELQFLISISCILLANIVFNGLDIEVYLLELFKTLIFASYSVIFVSILITLFLYFDLRVQAIIVSATLFVTCFFFSYFFGKLGENFTGVGFFLSSFITFVISVYMFLRIFDTLSYTVLFRQNLVYKVGGVFLQRISLLFNKKMYIFLLVVILFLLGGSKVQARYDERGFNVKTGNNWHTMSPYDKEGYDINGLNREGVDRRGFNRAKWHEGTKTPYDYYGFDYNGIHKNTQEKYDERGFDLKHFNIQTDSLYDKNGFDYTGIHKETGREYDKNGWNYYGLNEETQDYYNKDGWNFEGINERGFNKDGWNTFTKSPYDNFGFDFKDINKETKKEYDDRGFNASHFNIQTDSLYDKNGFDYLGIHKETGREYDKNGWNYYGLNEETQDYYNKDGWSFDGINKQGFNKDGWNIFTKSKYDYAGFDYSGVHKKTRKKYDERGFDNKQINVYTNTKYDKNGFDYEGINKDTGRKFDKQGWNFYGLNEKTGTYYDKNGYTREGLDKYGFKRGQRPKNFDAGEYDKDGFDEKGIYKKGY